MKLRNRVVWVLFGFVLSFMSVGPVLGQNIDLGSLPADRFPDGAWQEHKWQDPGGWTVVDVTTAGILPGASDASSQLMTLANDATVPTVLYFPPGEYTLRSAVDINNDNVIIRGAGSDQTRILLDGSAINGIRFLGWNRNTYSVQGNVAAGSQTLLLSSTSGLEVGDMIQINQELYNWDAEWGKRSWGQLVSVTAISGNQISIDDPLTMGLDAGQDPEVLELRPLRNVGVEDLYIERKQYDESSNIEFRTVYNAFVRNVESYNAVKFHVFVYRGRQIEISGNYIHDAQNYGTGGHGYGVNLENLSTQILVTNNIFKNLRHHILVQTGVNNSVISYNYNVDIKELVDLSLHGHFSNHNLYEGNVVWWAGFADFWGQLGPRNTLFRNLVKGKSENNQGVVIYDNSDTQNVISNYYARQSYLEKDADVDDLYEEGNVINGVAEWNTLSGSATIPASLYLTSAPDFWPNDLPWPAYGADVDNAELQKIPAQLRYEQIIGIGPGPGDTNDKPKVEITSPENGTHFITESDIQIDATASDTDGIISRVDFYIDGTWQGTDVDVPYEFVKSGLGEGSYVITVAATDNEGATTVSEEVAISIAPRDNDDVYIKSVLASHSSEGAGPENTLDGSLATRWAAHGPEAWVQYQLSGLATFSSIAIAWSRGTNRVAYFDVATSLDGLNWTEVATDMESSGTSKELETYNITPVEARYIRIIGHGTSSNLWNLISEVDLGVESGESLALGDPTGNGTISASDAAVILQHTVGYVALDGAAFDAGDVTGNGDITALDASLVLQYVTGLIDCFPAEAGCSNESRKRVSISSLVNLPLK